MDLCTQLRAATDPVHAAVEALPLARAMAAGTVARDEYVVLLRHLLAAHRAWEGEAALTPACAPVWTDRMARADVIEGDLAALGTDPTPAAHPAVDIWLASLRERAEVRPEVWLGVVYLFEGSRMGSMALLRPVSRALGVAPAPGQGVDYHLDGIADRVPRWQRLKAVFNALPLSPEQQKAAVWGAVATFQMLGAVYAAPVPAPAA
ncbi:MAG: biliverdin-producing heme oxygenase [Gemmataceae bacterium]